MRHSGALAVAVFSTISFLFAQDLFAETLLNGRGWNKLETEIARVAYVVGYAEGLKNGLGAGSQEVYDLLYPEILSNAGIVHEIDRFYEDRTNILIPVSSIFRWLAMKTRGTSMTELDDYVSELRRAYQTEGEGKP